MIINLQSQEEKDLIKAAYKKRFWIVAFWSTFFVAIVSVVILTPPFIISISKTGEISHSRELTSRFFAEDESTLAFPKTTNAKSDIVLGIKALENISDKILAINAAKPVGTEITGISYAPVGSGKNAGMKMTLLGVAGSREALLSLEKNMKQIDFVKQVKIPVSSFTKNTNLPFSMEILLK